LHNGNRPTGLEIGSDQETIPFYLSQKPNGDFDCAGVRLLLAPPFLSLVSEERVQNTLDMMDRPTNAPLTFELAREVCERTGRAAVLEGSIARLGSKYVLGYAQGAAEPAMCSMTNRRKQDIGKTCSMRSATWPAN